MKKLIFSLLLLSFSLPAFSFGFKFNFLPKSSYIKNYGAYRSYANNTYAISCNQYRNTDGYLGDIGDGIYRIKPDNGSMIDVYCDMTNGGFTEVFDLNKTPTITLSDLVAKLQQFNLADTLSTNNFTLNSNGLLWKNLSVATSGYSVGLSRIPFTNVTLSYNYPMGANSNQSLIALHKENKTDCSGNTNISTSCYVTAYSLNTIIPFQFFDSTTGSNDWNVTVNGSSTTYINSRQDTVNFNVTQPIFLTMAGRIEDNIRV